MTPSRRSVLRVLPATGMMAMIFFLSHQPGDALPLPALPGLDKLLHLIVYGLLAASLIAACSPTIRQSRSGIVATCVVLWCLVYGISDEFHQSFIPGRCVSVLDVVADTFGAMVVGGGWLYLCQVRGAIDDEKSSRFFQFSIKR
jgi:VanZ family protein